LILNLVLRALSLEIFTDLNTRKGLKNLSTSVKARYRSKNNFIQFSK